MNIIEACKQGKLHQLPDKVQQESEDCYVKFRGVQRGMLVNDCSSARVMRQAGATC